MTDKNELSNIESLEKLNADDSVELGKWYLLNTGNPDLYYEQIGLHSKESNNEIYKDEGMLLVCVDSFQSNLVIVKSNQRKFRILNKNLGHALFEIDQHEVPLLIQEKGIEKQKLIANAQIEIKEIMKRVHYSGKAQSGSTELMVATNNALIEQKRALQEVHSVELEQLNNEIRSHVAAIRDITNYYSLSITAGMIDESKTLGVIEDKLHELDLYGGLSEKETIISTGISASTNEPIHIFQNLKYMDVECLLGFASGSLLINSVEGFNAWLAEPTNRDRILPKPKSIVAINVRRHRIFGRLSWDVQESYTMLYLRNGENIKCIKSSLNIGNVLLATENNANNRRHVKKVGSYNVMSKNFVFLSSNEYDYLSEKSKQLKPLFLDTMLDAYRTRHKSLLCISEYAKLKHEKLGNGQIKNPRDKVILLENEQSTTYPNMSQADYDLAMIEHEKEIDLVAKRITDIKNAINSGFSSIDFTYPKIVSRRHELIKHGEIGFIDIDGVQHKNESNSTDLQMALKKISDRYYDVAPHFPNAENTPFHNNKEPTPFNIEKDLTLYQPMDEDNYYFDELKELNWRQYMRQNELAILIQGLIDRTGFFGYTEASLFKDDYSEHIKLVYDKDKGLYNGDMPDFNAFIEHCNKDSKAGDVFYGHESIWDDLEEDKEYKSNSYRAISIPTYLEAEKVIKKRDGRTVVKFRWKSARPFWSDAKSSRKTNIFECDIDKLINVSNYKLNDCKPFVEDPRCREAYPLWAAKILSAQIFAYARSKDDFKNGTVPKS